LQPPSFCKNRIQTRFGLKQSDYQYDLCVGVSNTWEEECALLSSLGTSFIGNLYTSTDIVDPNQLISKSTRVWQIQSTQINWLSLKKDQVPCLPLCGVPDRFQSRSHLKGMRFPVGWTSNSRIANNEIVPVTQIVVADKQTRRHYASISVVTITVLTKVVRRSQLPWLPLHSIDRS
jgi:hypothetical protein